MNRRLISKSQVTALQRALLRILDVNPGNYMYAYTCGYPQFENYLFTGLSRVIQIQYGNNQSLKRTVAKRTLNAMYANGLLFIEKVLWRGSDSNGHDYYALELKATTAALGYLRERTERTKGNASN